jgi:hypothetical protein
MKKKRCSQSRLQEKSQPVDQLDRVIEEIRRLIMKSSQEIINKMRRLIRGEPTVAPRQQ